MTHPNAEALRRMDEAMMGGDFAAFFGGYTDDVATHIGGDSKLTGDYQGLDQLQALFGRFIEACGDYAFENHAYLADDDHGVILQRGTMTKDGGTFSTNEVFVYHFRDGKVSEFWYLPLDQAGVDAWWGK
jgi:ketosteroid isomerase-like protein